MVELNLVVGAICFWRKASIFQEHAKYFLPFHLLHDDGDGEGDDPGDGDDDDDVHIRTLLPSATLHLFPATRCKTPSSLHHQCHHHGHFHHHHNHIYHC